MIMTLLALTTRFPAIHPLTVVVINAFFPNWLVVLQHTVHISKKIICAVDRFSP
jgi:hypothetical protein